MDKVLVTGGSGLLGANIAKISSQDYKVYATYRNNRVKIKGVEFYQTDLSDRSAIQKITEINPDLIIHCAAQVNVDYCEDHPEEAHKENVIASANVAEAANKCGAYLVHISTDAVFDGIKGNYSEGDKVNPINIYGRTKLEAENRVLEINPNTCVARTNIYGYNILPKMSLAEWMISKLEKKEVLPGFKDIIVSPILVNDLSNALFKLWKKEYAGILHVSGSESCSKLELAYNIADVFNLDEKLIKPVMSEEVKLRAQRGKNLSLNVTRAEKIIGTKLPNLKEGLKEMKKLRDSGYVNELKNG